MSVIEVAIGSGGAPDTFKVEVVASPAGEASATVELDAEGLLARRGLLQQAVLASAVPSRRVLPETEQPVREAGQVLFAGLLGAGEVAGRYRAAAAVAAVRGEGLRVVLRIDTPALAGLPWEAMYDQAAGAYVCRQDQLVRHVPVPSVPAPLKVRPPLRILGVVSSPRGLPPLDVDKEQDQLARALARPATQALAELHWAPTATWADLQDLLLDSEWHVLHFIGHGDFDPAQDEGVLALTREDGRADLVAAHRLVDLLRQARPMPRLVVLNSCSGAAAGVSDLFSGTAAALIRGGVSAVAAMQFEISDLAAVAFARGFYSAVARGRGVDDAVSSGRVAILGLSDRTLEWVTPVLYLRGHDTRLFTLPAPAGDGNRDDTGTEHIDSGRSAQPGDTISPGAAGDPRGDNPADRAGARAEQPPPTPIPPSHLARTLTGHTGQVWGVAFSPDGRLLATAGGGDGTARLWDVATGGLLRTLGASGYADPVVSVGFSPDGRLLATAGNPRMVWDVATGERLRTLTGHDGEVWDVAFSPDGRLLATTSDPRTVRVWDVATRDCLRTLTGHTDRVRGVTFSPDGRLLATTSDDKMARVWDVATGDCLRTLTGHTDRVRGVAFSPDGRLLATAARSDKMARLWDVATGEHLRALTGHDGEVWDVAFSPDGRLLATAGGDGTARLWDSATEHLQEVADTDIPRVAHTDRALFSTGVAAGQSTPAAAQADAPGPPPDPPSHLARTLTGHGGDVYGVAFSPDGRLLATASLDRTARLWDPATGEQGRTLTGHDSGVTGVAFSPDGRLLATADIDRTARLWDPATGEHLRSLTGHDGAVYSVAFSPDGHLLATAGHDTTARLWDPATGEQRHALTGHDGPLLVVAFSPDGHLFATAGGGGTARLWDPATGEQRHALTGHDGAVYSVAFSPDGHLFATAGGGGTARLWDPATGEQRHALTGHDGAVYGVAFSPDGHLLATVGGNGTARLWDWPDR